MTINSKLGQLTLNKANKKLKSTKNFSMSTRRKNLPKKKKRLSRDTWNSPHCICFHFQNDPISTRKWFTFPSWKNCFQRKKWTFFSYQVKGTLSTHLYKRYANLEVIKNTALSFKICMKEYSSLLLAEKKRNFFKKRSFSASVKSENTNTYISIRWNLFASDVWRKKAPRLSEMKLIA